MSAEHGYQLVVFSREAIQAFRLPATGDVTIGRDPASDVLIEDPGVSRQHAILRVRETLELEDLGGANGTFVRQTAPAGPGNETANVKLLRLVGKKARLAVGDCLLFGTACVVLRRAPRLEIPDLAPGVVVQDSAMQALYADAARVARANINVILLGETGVGKEVLARAIHRHSQRAKGPFVGINCAALAESLLENELFGSEKGAFTGALSREGLFEAAHGGTVFLDEVGELPLATQAKLLRVLEERVVTRLGSTRPRAIDVRILSATNRDLAADSREGRMRPDLYFRLNGVALSIPPLRSRAGDLEALAGSFLAAACRDLERVPPLSLSPAALRVLSLHAWPGNVRELRNAIERAAVMCTESTIEPEHLPPALLAAARSTHSGTPLSRAPAASITGNPAATELKELERRRIIDELSLAVLERWETEGRTPGQERGASVNPTATPPEQRPSGAAPHARAVSLRREGDLWALDSSSGTTVRLKGSKGLAYLNELLTHPGQQLHVLRLAGPDQAGPVQARGAAGPDEGERREASEAERARINVQRRLKDAIASIADCDAELGRYLTATVKTGTHCSFTPI